MTSIEPRQLLRTDDIATVLGITRQTASVRLKKGMLPGYFIGGTWFAFRDELLGLNEGTDPVGRMLEGWPDPLTLMELAQLFGKGPQATNDWLRNDVITAHRPAKQWLVYHTDVRAAFDAGRNTRLTSMGPALPEEICPPVALEPQPASKPWLEKTLRELGLR